MAGSNIIGPAVSAATARHLLFFHPQIIGVVGREREDGDAGGRQWSGQGRQDPSQRKVERACDGDAAPIGFRLDAFEHAGLRTHRGELGGRAGHREDVAGPGPPPLFPTLHFGVICP